jgi:hypothetical protein
MHRYYEPLLVNGGLMLVLGSAFLFAAFEQSLGGLVIFLFASWVLPISNAFLFIDTLGKGRRHLVVTYALLTLLSFGLTWWLWTKGMSGIHKIGG